MSDHSIYQPIEALFNQAVELSPPTQAELSKLAGKTIAIHLTGIDVTLFFQPGPTQTTIKRSIEGEPDTTIKGSPLSLLKMSLSEQKINSLLNQEVEISGDIQLGEQFQKTLATIDIDWEEQLSRLTGDVIAHKAGNLFRSKQRWNQQAKETFLMNFSEYLQEEKRLLPLPHEIQDFTRKVDILKNDLERLQAKIQLLQRRDNT